MRARKRRKSWPPQDSYLPICLLNPASNTKVLDSKSSDRFEEESSLNRSNICANSFNPIRHINSNKRIEYSRQSHISSKLPLITMAFYILLLLQSHLDYLSNSVACYERFLKNQPILSHQTDIRHNHNIRLNPLVDIITNKAGIIREKNITLSKQFNPILISKNIVIEKHSKLTIEAGAELLFEQRKGLIVYGVLEILGNANDRVKLNLLKLADSATLNFRSQTNRQNNNNKDLLVRLVDGDLPSEGRVQINFNDRWHSLCTNSKNLTAADIKILCQQVGYNDGYWYKWFPRRNDTSRIPQIMSKSFHCSGSESSITQCKRWNRVRIGGGICEPHSDIGLRCSKTLVSTSNINPLPHEYWRGIEFVNSETTFEYVLDGQMKQKVSKSLLRHVTIGEAGINEAGNATAAVRVLGQSPRMSHVEIRNSIYGIMIEEADDAMSFDNIHLHHNLAAPMFVNTSWGKVTMDNFRVENNGGDGMRLVRHEKLLVGSHDFCKFPNLGYSQTFPVSLSHEQTFFSTGRDCCQEFISNDHQLTVHFAVLRSTPNNLLPDNDANRRVSIPEGVNLGKDGQLLIYDDYREDYPFRLQITNGTRAQSIVSKSGRLKICYEPAHYRTVLFTIEVVADHDDDWSGRARDFEISNSLIQNNEGRGIWIDNQRSGSMFINTTVLNHNYLSGIHVENGTGEVIVQGCKLSNNTGHGLYINLAGGYYHVDNSSITDNTLKGIYLDYDKRPELVAFNHTFHIGYSLVGHNGENGLFIGNVCRSDAFWNVSMNSFVKNTEDAIIFQSCLPTLESVRQFKANLPRWNQNERNLNGEYQELLITHNTFYANFRRAIHMAPVMFLKSMIRHNLFRDHPLAVIHISNQQFQEQEVSNPISTFVSIRIASNRFYYNQGRYVANIGVQEDNAKQSLVFTKNFLEENVISEPYTDLKPRSRVSAVVVVTSSNTRIVRNRFDNQKSAYELGSHLETYTKVINATTNFWGHGLEAMEIYKRIFDRKNRYNLAQVEFLQYLLSPDDLEYATDLSFDRDRDKITNFRNGSKLGGEVKGYDELEADTYIVQEDIYIRPRAHLIIKPGAVLKFQDGVGMMVQGRLDALGQAGSQIVFTSSSGASRVPKIPPTQIPNPIASPWVSDSDIADSAFNGSSYRLKRQSYSPQNVRLSHVTMGRLEVQIEGVWGSVCDYNFDIDDAALVCQQLGMILNKEDWLLDKFQYAANDNQQISMISTNVLMTNLRCDPSLDTDLTKCKSEISLKGDFDGLCNSEVGIRCLPPSWTGVRLGMGAETSKLEHIIIQRAGMYDYATYTLRPALQIDFNRHLLNSIVVKSNSDSGLGIMWNDVIGRHFSELSIQDSKFINNERHGIVLRTKGLNVKGCSLSGNHLYGLDYNPSFSRAELDDLLLWLNNGDNRDRVIPITFPLTLKHFTIPSSEESHRFFVLSKFPPPNINESFTISADPGHMLSIHLLNPIHVDSTEALNMSTGTNADSPIWDIRMNMTSFPMVSASYKFHFNYSTGERPRGNIVLYVRSRYNNRDFRLLTRHLPPYLVMPKFEQTANNINSKLLNSLVITNSNITKNGIGLRLRHPNYFFGSQARYSMRYSNETVNITSNTFDGNLFASVMIGSEEYEFNADLFNKTIPPSEISYNVIGNKFQRNKDGIRQFSRDLRQSHNVFHWTLNDNLFSNNREGGINFVFPYYWRYDANLSHSLDINNNTFYRNNQFEFTVDGHFVNLTMTRNNFKENRCKAELVSILGMEKQMLIKNNVIEQNSCDRLVDINILSHADKFGHIAANFTYNSIRLNHKTTSNATNLVGSSSQRNLKQLASSQSWIMDFALSIGGLQPMNVTRNLFFNPELRYELLAGLMIGVSEKPLNAVENYWGSVMRSEIEDRIFDFDDWNSFAVINISPYLAQDSFTAATMVLEPTSNTFQPTKPLGGRLHHNLSLQSRKDPYVVDADLTIMPNATLLIERGVTLEFMPNVGILVLGDLIAAGSRDKPIIMKPFFSANDFIMTSQLMKPLRDPPNMMHANLNDQNSFDYIYTLKQHQLAYPIDLGSTRLCKNEICSDSFYIWDNNIEEPSLRQEAIKGMNNTWKMDGFLEIFNMTTLQWVPVCDPSFTEFTARVVCRKLGYSHLTIFKRGRRYTIEQEQISSVKSWFQPVQCEGDELSLSHCPLAPSGFQNYSSACTKGGNQFIYIYCQDFPEMAPTVMPSQSHNPTNGHLNHWGGIRFACSSDDQLEEFDNSPSFNVINENIILRSNLKYVSIDRAGMLHNKRSPAVQVLHCPVRLEYVAITNSAHNGLDIVSSQPIQNLHQLRIRNNIGIGFNYISLSGSSSAASIVPYLPLKHIETTNEIFGLIDICGAHKEIEIEDRILLFYRYTSQSRDCIKIVSSKLQIKRIGIRMLQFDLFNLTSYISRPDSVKIYDGNIFDRDSKLIADLGVTDTHRNEKPELKFYQSTDSTMTIRLHASGASSHHGFIAEVMTTPISHTTKRDAYNNMTFSDILNNKLGAINVYSAGESTPNMVFRSNRIESNCMHLFGNFTSCISPIYMVLQNCQKLQVHENLIKNNQGGLVARSYSQSSISALEATIENNVFESNLNTNTLALLGPKTDPYQTAKITQNIFTRNQAPYLSNILLSRIVANFSHNQVTGNTGKHQIEVLGLDKVPFSYQNFDNNWIYNNIATFRNDRSTVYGTSAGQVYRRNYIVNPDNSFELSTMNWSRYDVRPFHTPRDDEIIHLASGDGSTKDVIRKTADAIPINIIDTKKVDLYLANIDAKLNWWGFNLSSSIQGRIRDRFQHDELIKVDFVPFLETNSTLLSGICAGGWQRVGLACLLYVGAKMTYQEARDFCDREHATLPLLRGNHYEFTEFIQSRSRDYHPKIDRIWIRSFEVSRDACPTLNDYRTRNYDCQDRNAFLCEKDPQVVISLMHWYRETDGLLAIILTLVTLILIILCTTCWAFKSRHRHKEKMLRKNTIYASMRSNRNPYASNNSLSEGFLNRPIYNTDKTSLTNVSLSSQTSSQRNTDRFMQHTPTIRYDPGYSSQNTLTRGGISNNPLPSFTRSRQMQSLRKVLPPSPSEGPNQSLSTTSSSIRDDYVKSPTPATSFRGSYTKAPSSLGSHTSEPSSDPMANYPVAYGQIMPQTPALRSSLNFSPNYDSAHNNDEHQIGHLDRATIVSPSQDQFQDLGESLSSAPTYYSGGRLATYRKSAESFLDSYQANYNANQAQELSNDHISYALTEKSSIFDQLSSSTGLPLPPPSQLNAVNMNPEGVLDYTDGNLAKSQAQNALGQATYNQRPASEYLIQNQNRYCVETSFDFETPTMAPTSTFGSSQRLSPVSSFEAHADSNLGSRVYLETSFE